MQPEGKIGIHIFRDPHTKTNNSRQQNKNLQTKTQQQQKIEKGEMRKEKRYKKEKKATVPSLVSLITTWSPLALTPAKTSPLVLLS